MKIFISMLGASVVLTGCTTAPRDSSTTEEMVADIYQQSPVEQSSAEVTICGEKMKIPQ